MAKRHFPSVSQRHKSDKADDADDNDDADDGDDEEGDGEEDAAEEDISWWHDFDRVEKTWEELGGVKKAKKVAGAHGNVMRL